MNQTQEFHSKLQNNPTYQKKLLKYFYQCIFCEGSKILLFSIFAMICHLFTEFLVALLALMLVRTNGGGIHCKHYISCLILSFTILFGTIFLGIHIKFPDILIRLILVVCIFIGFRNVPITSRNRPAASEILIKKSKRNTVLILSAFLLLVCIVPYNHYLNIGFWTITIHILQLLIAKLLTKIGGE